MSPEDQFEDVHTVFEYYDGPRKGVADFEGAPHVYESEWDSKLDNYSEVFRLSPVSSSVFEAALENWAIWLRWEEAFHAGQVDQSTHPALPEDRARHDALSRYLKRYLQIDVQDFVRARGVFKPVPEWNRKCGVGCGLRVRWSRVPAAA